MLNFNFSRKKLPKTLNLKMSNKILNYMYHALFDFCHFTNIYLLTKIESQNLFLIRINWYQLS